jgi:hypothetical protein
VLVWTVVGPADGKIGAGIFSQRYIKAKGTSGEVPMLVGEKNPAIVLQSETNNGSAAYVSITQIELELIDTPMVLNERRVGATPTRRRTLISEVANEQGICEGRQTTSGRATRFLIGPSPPSQIS